MTWTLRFADDVIDARTPNSRGHWTGRQRSAKAVREAVGLLAHAQRQLAPVPPVAIRCTRWVTTRHKRDVDNTATSWKPALDGLVDAGVLPADDWTVVVEVAYRIRLAEVAGWTVEITDVDAGHASGEVGV